MQAVLAILYKPCVVQWILFTTYVVSLGTLCKACFAYIRDKNNRNLYLSIVNNLARLILSCSIMLGPHTPPYHVSDRLSTKTFK